MNGISAIIKETPKSFLVPSTMGGHSEITVYESGSGLSPDTGCASTLIWTSQPSEL